jgi:hypothetical protein
MLALLHIPGMISGRWCFGTRDFNFLVVSLPLASLFLTQFQPFPSIGQKHPSYQPNFLRRSPYNLLPVSNPPDRTRSHEAPLD